MSGIFQERNREIQNPILVCHCGRRNHVVFRPGWWIERTVNRCLGGNCSVSLLPPTGWDKTLPIVCWLPGSITGYTHQLMCRVEALECCFAARPKSALPPSNGLH